MLLFMLKIGFLKFTKCFCPHQQPMQCGLMKALVVLGGSEGRSAPPEQNDPAVKRRLSIKHCYSHIQSMATTVPEFATKQPISAKQ